MKEILDHVTEGVLVVGSDWRIEHANSSARTLLEAEEPIVGKDVRETFPRSVEATFHKHYAKGDVSTDGDGFEEYYPSLERWLAVDVFPRDSGVLVRLRDVTSEKEQAGELESRERELRTLTQVNTLIQDIIDSLVGAKDRSDIEESVCERLAGTDLYEFAWIAEADSTQNVLTSRTAVGPHGEFHNLLARSDEHVDRSTALPEHTAINTGTSRVSEELPGDSSIPESIRRAAFAAGIHSSLAVPLQYGNTTYGVLGIYASRPDAFSDRERISFETLGRAVGFAINATRQRNLVLSDTVVELTFEIQGSALPNLSGQLDCSIALEGTVPLDEGRLLCYILLEDATPEAFLAESADLPYLEVNRIIHDLEEGGLLSLTVSGDSSILSLSEHGASIREATFERGTGRVVTEVPLTQDIRAITEDIGDRFDDVSLVSKREEQRSVETAQEFRSELEDELTDRQRTVLTTAFLGDYFESPRGSTAEELAESLDITSPTFHHHLRAAERKLIGAFLDDEQAQQLDPSIQHE